MKLRIKGNTLRMRLLQGDVNQIAQGETVEESICFNFQQQLTYSLCVSDEITKIKAEYSNHQIIVWLPKSLAERWATSSEVGLEAEQENSTVESLKILIEKDFKCLDTSPYEDQSDNFPNPKADVGGC